jgi:hypothetical protein
MDISSDGEGTLVPSLSRQFSPGQVNMTLTQCGLLPDRTEELARLYREEGNWNDVKEVWFEERISDRSTRGSSQKIFSVLSSRLKNAPASLPKPRTLPTVLDNCVTASDKAQVVYFYLVSGDALFRYTVHEYISRLVNGRQDSLDFSDETLKDILFALEFTDETTFDYADSTTQRWCEGFRSVMREISVLDSQQATSGSSPSIGDIPLLVSMGYSYETGGDDWVDAPTGLLYLFQPENKWDEQFDRVASTDTWEFVELHGDLRLQPTDDTYQWAESGGEE